MYVVIIIINASICTYVCTYVCITFYCYVDIRNHILNIFTYYMWLNLPKLASLHHSIAILMN